MIKPNNTVALILVLVTILVLAAAFIMNRFLRPDRFLSAAGSSARSSGSVAYYVDSTTSASTLRIDPAGERSPGGISIARAPGEDGGYGPEEGQTDGDGRVWNPEVNASATAAQRARSWSGGSGGGTG